MDKLIWLLFSVNLLFQASTCMFAPFFPGIAKEERGLSLFMIGLTMSISSVAFVIFSYIAGHIIKYIGRRQSIYFGLAITGVAMIGFGVLYWITNYTMFVLFALFLRFICGVGQGLVSVSCYAIATIKYKDSLQQKLGLLEAGNGAGFLAGPLFGGIIYQLTHFSVPFFIWWILLFIQIYFLKQTLDESWDSEIVNSKNDEISYVYLLRHKRIFFATIAQFLNIFILTYGQPIFGPRMENDYHFPVAVIGAIYAIPCISYALTGPIFLQKNS